MAVPVKTDWGEGLSMNQPFYGGTEYLCIAADQWSICLLTQVYRLVDKLNTV